MTKTIHPWAKYRQAAGFTQSAAADRVGVTRHMLIRLEQSLFWNPPDSLTVRLAMLYEIELSTFEEAYYQYVDDRREAFAKLHKPFEETFEFYQAYGSHGYSAKQHPLVFYRDRYEFTRMGLCKALCLHYDPITEYEQNKQRAIPDQLVDACEDMQWDWQPLAAAVADWRKLGYANK